MDDIEFGYLRIMNNLAKRPVHPLFRPVHFTEDMVNFSGSGTLILNRAGQHTGVITAAHLFRLGKVRPRLFYQVLQPFSSVFYPVNSATEILREDVALCRPGLEAPIQGFSLQKCAVDENIEGTPYKASYPDCTHLATGRKIPVLGHIVFQSGETYFVLAYHNFPGESGSGFLRNSDELYVLKGKLALNDSLRDTFKVPKRLDIATLAAGIKVQT
ncbi:MAG: hypothetical protein ABSF55_03925 [Candidatus Staskawiczbacteria bacterium]|jgi:hypothetical protein